MYQTGRKIHFVGIGGIGMSGIAEVLLNLGHKVSGSDLRASRITERLASLGAEIHEGHAPNNVGDAFVVVTSSAVKPDNPEVVYAHEQMIPVIPRAEMLAELMRMKYGVAVAGTHGKTTTTSLVATVLDEAGFDPTVVVGGKVGTLGSNARLGRGRFLVAEADESDGSFLFLAPTVAVITNIDREHMDHYRDEAAIEAAFVDFANKVPFYGAVVVCLDDPRVQELLPRLKRRALTYGMSGQADISARHLVQQGGRTRFEVMLSGEPVGEVDLSLPGEHNALNALAAFGVCVELGAPPETIIKALSSFGGVDRRSQVKGEANGVLVVDDYGHHPTEIQAILKGLREAYDRPIVALFQPHRYSRTQDLAERFHTCFYDADRVLVTDIYAAGEAAIPGVDAPSLVEGIRAHGHRGVSHLPDAMTGAAELTAELKPGELLVTLGAGNIWQAGERILALLQGETDE